MLVLRRGGGLGIIPLGLGRVIGQPAIRSITSWYSQFSLLTVLLVDVALRRTPPSLSETLAVLKMALLLF